jgi:hypothetical protein
VESGEGAIVGRAGAHRLLHPRHFRDEHFERLGLKVTFQLPDFEFLHIETGHFTGRVGRGGLVDGKDMTDRSSDWFVGEGNGEGLFGAIRILETE